MTYQPVVPFGGVAGWAFLSSTLDAQEAAFVSSGRIVRDTEYFEANIGSIQTAEDLVADRRLLNVALAAFGLEDDINAKAFVQQVLESDPDNPEALASKLTDQRYTSLSEAFGFGAEEGPNTGLEGFGAEITAAYQERQFEVAVGNSSEDMRLALSLERELTDVLARDLSEDGTWFAIMANPPLRTVFERALGIPEEIGAIDIDQQLRVFKDKADAIFGDSDPSQFADGETIDELRTDFLARSDLNGGYSPTTRGAAALAILQNSA